MITGFLTNGCIKDTYDMKMVSKKMQLNPTIAISAIKGDISLNDLVQWGDTVMFDQNNLVKVIFKEDSILNLKVADFYDVNDMVSFNQSYAIGDMSIAPVQGNLKYTLDQISQHFSPALRNQFLALNDGSAHQFPSFPSVDLGEITFSSFTNFENAVFKSGFLDISIENNLTAPLNAISVRLYNTIGHTAIGGDITIPSVLPGQTQTISIDLTDKTISNPILAGIVLSGSPGNPNPVLIDLTNSNIKISVQGRSLRVKSGRVILPPQEVTSLSNKDTISLDPVNDAELVELKVITGNLTYQIQSTSPLSGSFAIKLPAVKTEGIPLTQTININSNSTQSGAISLDNTNADLGTDPLRPFNRIPIEYAIALSSNGQMINFNENDKIRLDLSLLNPDFDFLKGYFGPQTHTGDHDTLKLGINDIFDHISGDFLLARPSMKFIYSNSFAIPIELNLEVTGYGNAKSVDLGLDPFIVKNPDGQVSRDKKDSLLIDKTNSSLAELLSLPPKEIHYTGLAKMNPQGNSGNRDNYIFGNSRLIASLEMEIPLDFRSSNLQFTETVKNFLKVEGSDKDNPIKPENFESLRIDLTAMNGFPFGVSLKMSLYNSLTHSIKGSVNADKNLEPAQVDNNGKATTSTQTTAIFEFTKDFFNSIDEADNIIFQFTLVTPANGTKDVKIYSDYRIGFNAALVMKPNIILK